MIEVDTLAEAFVRHVGSCRSAGIVCALPIAVESWFRVELIPALIRHRRASLGCGKQENFLVQDAFSCDYLIVLCASF